MPAERDPACEPQTRASRLALLLYYAAYFASWLLLPALLGEEPAHDNLEQLDWARHPALGYSKHPPLPTWVLWLFEQIFPTGVNLTYALGGLTVAAMLGCAWYVTRCLLGGRLAWRATLLCTVVTWYTLRMNFYNHNSVLLATTAASFAALVHALRRDPARDWMLLGLCWGVLYILIFEHDPQAFNFGSAPSPTLGLGYNEAHLFPVFIYFSLTTLASIGYGDITPMSLQARYAAVAEGITGQFYLAILVARLVGLYITRAAGSDSRGERAP